MYSSVAAMQELLGASFAAIYGADAAAAASRCAADLEAAAAEIDGHLASRYRTPVSAASCQTLLADWNAVLAQERAYSRAPAQSDFTEKLKRRADEVRRCLREAATGAFALAADLVADADSGTEVAIVECDPPVFGRSRMRGF